ncbi:hypothetical protein ACFV0D_40450, partial [Streptomyces sp. NPDC059556]
ARPVWAPGPFYIHRGPHFTALAFGSGAATALDRLPWPPGGAPLRRHTVLTRTTPGTPDEAALLTAYGITEDTIVLVRPDGYIGDIRLTAGATDGDVAPDGDGPGGNGPDGEGWLGTGTPPVPPAIARLTPAPTPA